MGQTEEAIAYLEKTLEIEPYDAVSHSNLAFALGELKRFDEAMEHYAKASEIDEDYSKNHLRWAKTLLKMERKDQALEHIEQAFDIHRRLAAKLVKQDRTLIEAIEHYQKALKINDQFAQLHRDLAQALIRQGKYELAIDHFTKAISLAPEWPLPVDDLAWLLATHNNPKFRNGPKALRLAEKVCELTNYEHSSALITLAASYAETGQFAKAVATAEKSLKLMEQAGRQEKVNQIQQWLVLFKQNLPLHRDPRKPWEN